MHDAVCSECGRDCQVPFKPSGDKPVFCSDCFEKQNGGDNRSGQRGAFRPRFGGRDSGRSGRGDMGGADISQLTKNVEILNSKLDKIIALLGSSTEAGSVEVKEKGKKKSKNKKMSGMAQVVASLKSNEVVSTAKKLKKSSKKSASKIK